MSSRVRLTAIVSVIVVLFGIGAVVLVRQATGAHQRTSGSGPAGTSAAPTSSPATDPTATSDPTATGSSPPPATTDPPPPPQPGRSVAVAGARLDGSQQEEGCAQILLRNRDEVLVLVQIDRISLTVTDGDGTPVLDRSRCAETSGPFCEDVALGRGGVESCLVGFRLTEDPPAGERVELVAVLALRVTCTAPSPAPCDQIEDPRPSVASPVDAVWTAEGPPLAVEGPEEPPETTTPAPTATPEPSPTGDLSPSP